MSDYLPHYDRSHALVIGIDDYRDPSFTPLGNAVADARAFADLIAAPPYAFDTFLLLNDDATKQNILDTLFELERSGPDDRIMVYFAGHGYTLVNNFGHETGYLACFDTIPERHYTALRMDELTGLRENAGAKHISFILDACFSGQAMGFTRVAPAVAEQFLLRRAFQVISAGAPDQAVVDYQSMTQYLLDYLARPQQAITIDDLGVYVRDTVSETTRGMQIPQYGQISGSQGGDMILYLPPDERPLDRLPERLRRGLTSGDADTRFFAVASAENQLYDPDHGANVRAALEQMVVEDESADVRRRAFQALQKVLTETQVERLRDTASDIEVVPRQSPRQPPAPHQTRDDAVKAPVAEAVPPPPWEQFPLDMERAKAFALSWYGLLLGYFIVWGIIAVVVQGMISPNYEDTFALYVGTAGGLITGGIMSIGGFRQRAADGPQTLRALISLVLWTVAGFMASRTEGALMSLDNYWMLTLVPLYLIADWQMVRLRGDPLGPVRGWLGRALANLLWFWPGRFFRWLWRALKWVTNIYTLLVILFGAWAAGAIAVGYQCSPSYALLAAVPGGLVIGLVMSLLGYRHFKAASIVSLALWILAGSGATYIANNECELWALALIPLFALAVVQMMLLRRARHQREAA